MRALLEVFTDGPRKSVVQRLAERRLKSQMEHWPEIHGPLLPAMMAAYIEGFKNGKVPTEFDTPSAVALASMIGDGDRIKDTILN
jgi:hypothetical protein